MKDIAPNRISDASSWPLSETRRGWAGLLLASAVLLVTILSGCGGQAPTSLPPQPVAFPQHGYPLGTDRGGDYYAGQLVLQEGCLRIHVPSNPNNAPWPSRLAVWPSSFSLEQDSGTVRVLDGQGRVAARVGDHVRVSWAEVPYEEFERQELVTGMPEHCLPGLIFVGGDVTAFDPKNEVTELRLQSPEVLLLRQKTVMAAERTFMAALGVGELVLDGPCLRLNGGSLIVWPPGFTPHLQDGVVQILNGAGQVIAQVGDEITGGGGYYEKNHSECPGEAFHIHSIEVLPDVPVYFPQWSEEIKIGPVVKRRTGELTLDGKCLVIKNVLEGGGPDGMLPSWPGSYGLNVHNGTVECWTQRAGWSPAWGTRCRSTPSSSPTTKPRDTGGWM